jgi:hypothetical protein
MTDPFQQKGFDLSDHLSEWEDKLSNRLEETEGPEDESGELFDDTDRGFSVNPPTGVDAGEDDSEVDYEDPEDNGQKTDPGEEGGNSTYLNLENGKRAEVRFGADGKAEVRGADGKWSAVTSSQDSIIKAAIRGTHENASNQDKAIANAVGISDSKQISSSDKKGGFGAGDVEGIERTILRAEEHERERARENQQFGDMATQTTGPTKAAPDASNTTTDSTSHLTRQQTEKTAEQAKLAEDQKKKQEKSAKDGYIRVELGDGSKYVAKPATARQDADLLREYSDNANAAADAIIDPTEPQGTDPGVAPPQPNRYTEPQREGDPPDPADYSEFLLDDFESDYLAWETNQEIWACWDSYEGAMGAWIEVKPEQSSYQKEVDNGIWVDDVEAYNAAIVSWNADEPMPTLTEPPVAPWGVPLNTDPIYWTDGTSNPAYQDAKTAWDELKEAHDIWQGVEDAWAAYSGSYTSYSAWYADYIIYDEYLIDHADWVQTVADNEAERERLRREADAYLQEALRIEKGIDKDQDDTPEPLPEEPDKVQDLEQEISDLGTELDEIGAILTAENKVEGRITATEQ